MHTNMTDGVASSCAAMGVMGGIDSEVIDLIPKSQNSPVA